MTSAYRSEDGIVVESNGKYVHFVPIPEKLLADQLPLTARIISRSFIAAGVQVDPVAIERALMELPE